MLKDLWISDCFSVRKTRNNLLVHRMAECIHYRIMFWTIIIEIFIGLAKGLPIKVFMPIIHKCHSIIEFRLKINESFYIKNEKIWFKQNHSFRWISKFLGLLKNFIFSIWNRLNIGSTIVPSFAFDCMAFYLV